MRQEPYGAVLRAARIKAGLSQTSLAKILGVSTTYVCDVERGNRAPFTYSRNADLSVRIGANFIDLEIAAVRSGSCERCNRLLDAALERTTRTDTEGE